MTDLKEAASILEQGGVVGMPTETVYGLAARIDREPGIRRIFSVKERPFFDPLIVHVGSVEQARALVSDWPAEAEVLAKRFWPGPLTLVLPKNDMVSPLITSGLPTVGLRCPDHPVALALIREAGAPLAAPSANRFGRTSPTRAEHVESEFEGRVKVLDGGPCDIGIESTIVAVEPGALSLLRPGHLSEERLSEALAEAGLRSEWREPKDKRSAPGQMKHHYMPDKPLILLAAPMEPAVLLREVRGRLAELPSEVEGVRIRRPSEVNLLHEMSLPAEPAQAARELYQGLRTAASAPGDALVLVWPFDRREGDWRGLWDRLRKAASLRIE